MNPQIVYNLEYAQSIRHDEERQRVSVISLDALPAYQDARVRPQPHSL